MKKVENIEVEDIKLLEDNYNTIHQGLNIFSKIEEGATLKNIAISSNLSLEFIEEQFRIGKNIDSREKTRKNLISNAKYYYKKYLLQLLVLNENDKKIFESFRKKFGD